MRNAVKNCTEGAFITFGRFAEHLSSEDGCLKGGGSDIEIVKSSFEGRQFSAKRSVFFLDLRDIIRKFGETATEFIELRCLKSLNV